MTLTVKQKEQIKAKVQELYSKKAMLQNLESLIECQKGELFEDIDFADYEQAKEIIDEITEDWIEYKDGEYEYDCIIIYFENGNELEIRCDVADGYSAEYEAHQALMFQRD